MIVAILIGRKGSKGFPGKNLFKVFGHPLAFYPMKAAKQCSKIDKIYLSTDDAGLVRLAKKNKIEIIKRPSALCSDKALGEDVFVHAHNVIKRLNKNKNIELIVLLMCNAPAITSEIISNGIKVLRDNPEYDSAVTVSKYNMWSPVRARKIKEDGLLYPFIPFTAYRKDVEKINCDRESQGDVWFADMGVSIVRPRCIEKIKDGLLPQRWMGRKIFPLKQCVGLDVDFEWQIPLVEFWIRKYLSQKSYAES